MRAVGRDKGRDARIENKAIQNAFDGIVIGN